MNIQEYIDIWIQAKNKKYPMIDAFENKLGYKINRKWFHDLALKTQVVKKKHSICYQHGKLLYSILYKYIQDNDIDDITILETGTGKGFSSLCMAKVLKETNQKGSIHTFDIISNNIKKLWNGISDVDGKHNRLYIIRQYNDLIKSYINYYDGDSKKEIQNLKTNRIHFAFLDSEHTYDHLFEEIQYLIKKQKSGDIIFFDDYTPKYYPGIIKAVDEMCSKYNYSKIIITINEYRGFAIAKKLS